MRWKTALLASAVLAVSLAHYLTPVGGHGDNAHHASHAFYRWFYHLPIILAAFWYGLPGGLITAAGITALYLPHVLIQWRGGTPEQWLEIALYLVVGLVTGTLAQKLKAERDEQRRAGKRLNDAYDALRQKTRLLLEVESELRHADRLSTLGELSAGMAHEVKTPLASIRGAAEILAGGNVDEAERREFSDILLRETERLNRVVAQFLSFARPIPAEAESSAVDRAIEDVVRLLKPEADRQGVRVTGHAAPQIPPVHVHPEQLRQVLLNLAMNALQAMKANGGTLDLVADRVGEAVRVRVADTGPGIPPAILPRLFEPFVTSRPEGTGLGLSIVKRILDSHGASIEIRPAATGGTEATILLPLGEARHGGDEAPVAG